MSLSEVSAALLHEQSLLEMLLFKLEEEHLLLAAGRTRWLRLSAAGESCPVGPEVCRVTEIQHIVSVHQMLLERSVSICCELTDVVNHGEQPLASVVDDCGEVGHPVRRAELWEAADLIVD